MTAPCPRIRSAYPSPRPVTHIASKTSRGTGTGSSVPMSSATPAARSFA